MLELTIGDTFADHRIEALIGRGGMGLVYRATQLLLERPVALKLIAPELAGDQSFRDRFRRECRLAASLDHPNIVPVYEAGEEGERLYVTMRLVDGTDLRKEIDRAGALRPRRAADIVAQAGNALDAAHAGGLVHRDVKPANILIAASGDRVYLTDFGLSKLTGSSDDMTRTGLWVGTVDYVAPEQIQGLEIDARTDVYALGCVLYEALSGAAPFAKRTDVAKMFAHLNDAPPPLPAAVTTDFPELGDVVARAMAKDPADRYPSAGDLARAAQAAVAHEPVSEPERTVAQGAARPAPDAAAQTRVAAAPMPAAGSEPTRVQAGTGAGATAVAPRPTAARPARRPRWSIAAAGLALVAVVAAGLAIGGVFSTDTTTTTAPPPRPVFDLRGSVRATLAQYTRAYSAKDTAAIGALLLPGVHRKSGTSPSQTTRAAALTEYRRQFATLSTPTYALSDVGIAPTAHGAIATARYTISDGGSSRGSGTIRFTFVRVGATVRISALRITPA